MKGIASSFDIGCAEFLPRNYKIDIGSSMNQYICFFQQGKVVFPQSKLSFGHIPSHPMHTITRTSARWRISADAKQIIGGISSAQMINQSFPNKSRSSRYHNILDFAILVLGRAYKLRKKVFIFAG